MKTATWVKKSKKKTIELKCDNCNLLYNKAVSEYKRGLKIGRKKFFCSNSCSSSFRLKNNPITTDNRFDIGKWSRENNQSDNYTPFRYYLQKSKSRKWESNLDCDYLESLWIAQDGKCSITDIPMVLKTFKTNSKDIGMNCASLDRIDSSKGYIKGNVQFICTAINLAKNNSSDKEIRDFISLIIKSSNIR